jgi:hypothetical protein
LFFQKANGAKGAADAAAVTEAAAVNTGSSSPQSSTEGGGRDTTLDLPVGAKVQARYVPSTLP